MWFETESGSVYEVNEHERQVRRVNWGYAKRGDEEWQHYFNITPWPVRIGNSVVFFLNSLAELGPDDEGARVDGAAGTIRTTSPVTGVWG